MLKTATLDLGHTVITRAARDALSDNDVFNALDRHKRGDWGEVSKADWEANNLAVRQNTRILSAHVSSDGEKFWITTEADRSYTTILLPEDY